tara:strand:+ start:519 stop:902 length:384 start_codon:yes stop_codon:yes gene_type:complete
MNKTYKLTDLTDKEVEELRSCEDIKFVLTEHHPIHQSGQTDDFGNEISPTQYNYNVIVEILPSTEERELKVETFISSLTLPGKDHRIDRFSREYNYLKEELGINIEHKKRKIPSTLKDAVHELEDLI